MPDYRQLLLKVVFGLGGIFVGGWAGFWMVALAGEAILPAPDHPLAEPGTGFGIVFAAIFVGVPVAALVGCWLGVIGAKRLLSERRNDS
jgi:hypothetical protein